MTSRAIVWDGSFGDPTLTKLNLNYIPVLPNALYDWAAESLQPGPAASWSSMTGSGVLSTDRGMPEVIDRSDGRLVAFDGVSDRMRFRFDQKSPQTIVAVYRFTDPTAGDAVFYGYNGSSTGAVSIGEDVYTLSAYGNGKWIVPNPAVAPDDKWHIAMLVINGSSTVLRLDSREVPGNLPAGTRDGLALGYSLKSGNAAAIEYKRVVNFPYALNAASRDQLVNQLSARYGISI